jgi:hypothetical protein
MGDRPARGAFIACNGSIPANMTGIADTGVTDWLVAA